MTDKPIAVAEYPIRYEGKALRVPAADVAAVEVSISHQRDGAEETGDDPGDCTLTITVTFKPGASPTWQREV